ncbi:MAG: hypothetical protein ACR2PL_02105 [Dehalococcoidia bacterium]
MIPVGLLDVADVAAIPMLKAGAVVGLLLAGAPASGDTVSVQVYKNGAAVVGLSQTISNTAGSAVQLFSKDVAANQFNTGDLIGLRYTTTTSSSYTVRDIFSTVAVQYGLSE